jgi:hypothetical protein
MRRILFVSLILFISLSSFGQLGSLTGKVIDQKSGEPLVGAKVKLVSSGLETITDFDGNFEISSASAGINELAISYLSYEEAKLSRVIVKDGVKAELTIRLKRVSSTANKPLIAASLTPETSKS